MVTLKIDGVEVKAERNETILEVAERNGIYIPTFCHHKMLFPFGACRVCLVEVKGTPKLMTACTTPVGEGMDIVTQSERLIKLRRTMIELLLVHHPLDCPICDKGGECTLQDLTYDFGVSRVRFDEKPSNKPADHSNPFIERNVNRCVLCGKCVRICDEVVNIQSIGFIHRGTNTYIGTAFDEPWHCEFCGQCMSVCPVGSLNNRVYLFKNRPWNLKETYSICGFCSCGCTIVLDHENNEVYRIKEDVNAGINHGFLCVKGRFGYELINSPKRRNAAILKNDSIEKDIPVDEAINIAFNRIDEVIKKYGSDSVAFLTSPRLTNEEAYLVQQLARQVINTNNVYSFENALVLPEANYKDVEESDFIIVFNLDVTESNPILGLAVRRSARSKNNLTVFYPSYTALKRVASNFIIGSPAELYKNFEDFLSAIDGKGKNIIDLAEDIKKAKNPIIIFNPYNNYDLYYIKQLKTVLPSIKLLPSRIKNNSQGILDMGCCNGVGPGYEKVQRGHEFSDAYKTGKIKALVVFGENIVENHNADNFEQFRSDIDFMLVLDPFYSDTAKLADLYIPVSLYAEKNGSYTNLEGRVQSLKKAVDRGFYADLDILTKMFAFFGSEMNTDIDTVRDAIEDNVSIYKDINWDGDIVKYPYAIEGDFKKNKADIKSGRKFILYPEASRLHSGTFTRWSDDLIKVYNEPLLQINSDDAFELGINENDTVVLKNGEIFDRFKVHINRHITKGLLCLPDNYKKTVKFFHSDPYLSVDLEK